MERPGHDAFVAGQYAGAASGYQQAKGRRDGAGSSGRGVLGTIVEVAIAVVVEAGGDVVVRIASAVEVGTELDFFREGEGGVAEEVPGVLAGAVGEFSDV
jgi:hypothetical protein